MNTTTLQMKLIEDVRHKDVGPARLCSEYGAAPNASDAGAKVNAEERYGCSAYPQAESYGHAELCRPQQERGIETEHH